VLVRLLEARGFRNLREAVIEPGGRVTLIHGPNGAGKTNLLEALAFGLTGVSWRTRADRELIGFDDEFSRAEVTVADGAEARVFRATVTRGEGRRHRLDGNPVPSDATALRPAVAVFSPDRLTLVKGPPSERRRHLDSLVAALWPGRAEARRRFGRALAQRNALVSRIRSGAASEQALAAWDSEFAGEAAALVEARAAAIERVAPSFTSLAASLGLCGSATITYRPRTGVADAEEIVEQLRARRGGDLERGHSTHGPHLDEVQIAVEGRAVRRFGSQGEQRMALLALLFAEREALMAAHRPPPLMLLDDVMSELDPDRRRLLVELLEGGGQSVITATEPTQIPEAGRGGGAEVALEGGHVIAPAPAPSGIAA
jgi:DNA replication and repair protein RecF